MIFFKRPVYWVKKIKDWQHLNLTTISGRMMVNDFEVGKGKGADILGHPFESLAWLANHKIGRKTFLRAGEIVLLGSIVKTQWLAPGDKVVVEMDHLGKVFAEFLA